MKTIPFHPIDVHVGARVREARRAAGMNSIALAEKLGITFQQLVKNEAGINRIGCSRLFQIARETKQPVAFFFEGLDP